MATAARKSPEQPRSRATVELIVEGAASILEERGFEGYNTNAIARRAGVSIGSVYQYFPDKDAITAAVIRREATQFLDDARAARSTTGAHEGLIHLIDAAIRHRFRRPVLAQLIEVEETRLPLEDGETGVAEGLLDDLRKVMARRGLRPLPDRDEAARDIAAIIRGMIDDAGRRGEQNVAALARRVRAAVFGYIDRMGKTI